MGYCHLYFLQLGWFTTIMIPWDAGKSEYNESEAAEALGVSIRQLREMVRDYVTREDADLEVPVPNLRPTDLLLLKMLAQQQHAHHSAA